MYYDEYEKIVINEFNGLYKRGMPDECPIDHAICCENVSFTKKGEVSSRNGMSGSQSTAAASVTRMFLSTTDNGNFLLTCDGQGNIWSNAGSSPLFSYPGLFDFSAINIYGRTYIYPIVAGFPPAPVPNLQVFNGIYIRDAAGAAPGSSFSASTSGSGNVDAGVYQLAISFITDTGYVTPPGPLIGATYTPVIVTAPGGTVISVTGIPTGPTGTVGRQLFTSRANQIEIFFIPSSDGGVINDNTTTTATLNFFDTDLVESGDYLFDLFPSIPGSNRYGTINFYHNRTVILNLSTSVKLSRVQDPESINQVDGIIQFPDYGINSAIFGVCVQQDVLYLTEFPGIYAVQDTGDEPAFWPYILIDGGFGSLAPGIGSLSGTSNALTFSQTFLLCDRNGVFAFNGSIIRPALTWKIDDIWKQINFAGAPEFVSLFVDVVHDIFFVLCPIGSAQFPNALLMCDYSLGLDSEHVKWSLWSFPYAPSAITFINYEGNLEVGDGGFFLRIAFYNQPYIYAIKPGNINDAGAAILGYYRAFLGASTPGQLNQFRLLRFRATSPNGNANLYITLDQEDFLNIAQAQPPPIPMTPSPGQHYDRQINFAYKEKMSLGFGVGAYVGTPNAADSFTVQNIEIYNKPLVGGRPQ